MPKTKNQGKNKSRFEVRGGLLNEYEFALNEGAMTEEERNRLAQLEEARRLREGEEGATPMSPQEQEAARIREVMETAHQKAQRNIEKRERQAEGDGKGARRGAAGKAIKKSAGKKSAKKRAVAVGGGAARGARKGAAKKGSTKKGARKRG